MREFQDATGRGWQVYAHECTVAHGQMGACLAFRPADEPDAAPLETTIAFNSVGAAEAAIRTLGAAELRRRLQTALTTARR